MPHEQFPPPVDLSGFALAPQALEVVEELVEQGPDRLAIITDWDGVLAYKDPDGIGGTTWEVMKRNMPSDEHRATHSRLYQHYHPLEIAGTLTPFQSRHWQLQALSLMRNVSLPALRKDAQESILLRPGVPELFEGCENLGVPVIIKSTGSYNIIEAVTSYHGLQPAHIFSSRFTTDENERINGVEKDTLTHSHNKRDFSHLSAPGLMGRTAVIAIGDNPHDARMVRDQDATTTLLVRLDGGKQYHEDHHPAGAWEAYVSDSVEHGYHAVAIEPNMIAINGLIASISQRR